MGTGHGDRGPSCAGVGRRGTYDRRVDLARFTDRESRGVLDVRHDLACLDEGGFWAVVVTFEGEATCVRFADVRPTAGMPWAAPCADWSPLEGECTRPWTARHTGRACVPSGGTWPPVTSTRSTSAG